MTHPPSGAEKMKAEILREVRELVDASRGAADLFGVLSHHIGNRVDEIERAAALSVAPVSEGVEKLGRFGHHPDPVIDFEVEVDTLDGMLLDMKAGFESLDSVRARVSRALDFNVGVVESAIAAKARLRKIAALVEEAPTPAAPGDGEGAEERTTSVNSVADADKPEPKHTSAPSPASECNAAWNEFVTENRRPPASQGMGEGPVYTTAELERLRLSPQTVSLNVADGLRVFGSEEATKAVQNALWQLEGALVAKSSAEAALEKMKAERDAALHAILTARNLMNDSYPTMAHKVLDDALPITLRKG